MANSAAALHSDKQCIPIALALQKCYAEKPLLKFIGGCNDAKIAFEQCVADEVAASDACFCTNKSNIATCFVESHNRKKRCASGILRSRKPNASNSKNNDSHKKSLLNQRKALDRLGTASTKSVPRLAS